MARVILTLTENIRDILKYSIFYTVFQSTCWNIYTIFFKFQSNLFIFHIIQNITLAISYFSISCSKYFLLYSVPFSSLETLEYIYIRLVKWLTMRRKEKQKAWSQQTLGSELKAVTWMLWSSLFLPPFPFLPFSKLLCTPFQTFESPSYHDNTDQLICTSFISLYLRN